LPAEAKAEWDIVSAELTSLGLLTVVDGPALAAYCVDCADYREACEKLQSEGKVLVEQGRSKRNPWTMLKRQAKDGILRVAAEFGFTPSARVRLNGEGNTKKNTDGFDNGCKDARSA